MFAEVFFYGLLIVSFLIIYFVIESDKWLP